MKFVVTFILFTLTSLANAGSLVIHTVSYHSAYNRQTTEMRTVTLAEGWTYQQEWTIKPYNNYNFGLGYLTDDGFEVGAYYNSYRKVSVYAAKSWMYNEYVGVYLGLATGYKDQIDFPVAPVAGLILQLPLTQEVTARVTLQPPIGSDIDGVAHLSFTYKFKGL